jgi:hypothetical protein
MEIKGKRRTSEQANHCCSHSRIKKLKVLICSDYTCPILTYKKTSNGRVASRKVSEWYTEVRARSCGDESVLLMTRHCVRVPGVHTLSAEGMKYLSCWCTCCSAPKGVHKAEGAFVHLFTPVEGCRRTRAGCKLRAANERALWTLCRVRALLQVAADVLMAF